MDFIWDFTIRINMKTIAAYSLKILTGLRPNSNAVLKISPQRLAYTIVKMEKTSQKFSQNSHFVSLA
ncbi:MAG: hypothetical protein LBF13_06050 [Campylobacteraceae bacterium]|jgi:hypothetical protein|nr:hypothetical protein [Campylobacteraceae bacterium]